METSHQPIRILPLILLPLLLLSGCGDKHPSHSRGGSEPPQSLHIDGVKPGRTFEGIGLVNGGGATSVLLKDYPEPQRSQILDLVYKPKFGASVSTILVEIPGDGNSTQGSMPSHSHTRDDLDYSRGYTWWILSEVARRNPQITLDASAWSAPGWVGNGNFWSQDAADYYVTWLKGLRDVYGLELNAIGCRNEKGVDYNFAKLLRRTLDSEDFADVRIHAFDNWPEWKLDFVKDMMKDPELGRSVDIIGGHVFYEHSGVSDEVRSMADSLHKPIWNTEDHVYKKGYEALIGVVECLNRNYIDHGATKIVNWYDIAGVYELEPYSEDPATVLAREPWSGHYEVREALWGYAHYGQFTEVGWKYVPNGCTALEKGGSVVTLRNDEGDYSLIFETKAATEPQTIRVALGKGLKAEKLCVWRSTKRAQFIRQTAVRPKHRAFTITLEPNAVYSLSTTKGQQKGSYIAIPRSRPFPMPYDEDFQGYGERKQWGYLPHYLADIGGCFELVETPDHTETCLRQVVKEPANTWAPDWHAYTIVGDASWTDYEISADVWLNSGDEAGIMGRICHVGTGWGFIPKGYYLKMDEQGHCTLVESRGKANKTIPEGDAEQQELIRRQKDDSAGGEYVLGTATATWVNAQEWHKLTMRFEADTLTAFVDDEPVLSAQGLFYSQGMAGLMATRFSKRQSTPYFDNLHIAPVGTRIPKTPIRRVDFSPLYVEKPDSLADSFTEVVGNP